MKELTFTTHSPEETRELAARLGPGLHPGDVLALTGELGSGKTEFVRGLAQGLGVPPETPVASPSFILAREYPGRLTLIHLDLYRLEDLPPELLPDVEEYLYGPHVVAVEWAERLKNLLPRDCLEVQFTVVGESQRQLIFRARGERGLALLQYLVGAPDRPQ
ncbi:MAG: tRNA (adenosine(37)-N6)-threonylcarbamoyltransferase complex ATPase subunit type 1 TsaE, partial [Deltaproteobacteria bacterium]|nr:tRNA (adenosine(37)-N6)-threonylcarbamoyltransferase complex ATPase subunit type 1 TsaE [Deltaproteobacteria bacterium]